MSSRPSRIAALLATAAAPLLFLACGGSSSSTTPVAAPTTNLVTPTTGTLALSVSDASTEDWSTIGVKIMSIALTPQGGGAPVVVYTAPSPTPVTNLVQLDSLSDLLNTASVAPGVYTGATLTVSANPGDVSLVVAPDPESGFAAAAGSTIAPAQIQIQHAQGTAGALTVPVKVSFNAPITVTLGETTPLDLEFNLSHPAFIVDHVPASGPAFWAVSFNGPMVRHNPIQSIDRMILRHLYATVSSVSADHTSISVMRDYPVNPVTSPETATVSTDAVSILADASNGTIFYDVDAKTATPIKDFSSVASSLSTKFIRVAARYQVDGTLVAVRMWASSTFAPVWLNPEGHVLHTNSTNPALPTITVSDESGTGIEFQVNASTQFFVRTPANPAADAAPIGVGPAFVTSGNLVRGFKIHPSFVDALATPPVAQTVDIELARYDGDISLPTATGFTYTRKFATATDDYQVPLSFISATTANGKGATGTAVEGFEWWDFAYPTLADTGATAISDFDAATNGSINFFAAASKAIPAWGYSGCIWNDPAAADAWSTRWTILEPVTLPLGYVSGAMTTPANGSATFAMSVPTGVNPVTVGLTTTSGSATLVYQVDKTNGIVTVSPQDLTVPATLALVQQNLSTLNTVVKVYGIPQANGSVASYVVFYYTGSAPTK